MKFLLLIAGVRRGYYVLVVALAAMLLAVVGDWYPLPSSTLSSFARDILTPELSGAVVYEAVLRTVLALLAVVALVVLRFRPALSHLLAGASWLLLTLILAFPYVINHWYPEYSLDTGVVFRQVNRVVNDMEANLNWQQEDWRQTYTIAIKSQPLKMSGPDVFDDVWGLAAMLPEYQTHVLQDLLGYSNEFLNLVGRAWILGIVGLILLLLSLQLLAPDMRVFSAAPRAFACCFALVALGLLLPKLLGYYFIEQGKTDYAQGNLAAAELDWRQAERWSPALGYSLVYQARRGELAQARGCGDCSELLFFQLSQAAKTGQYWRAEQLVLRAEHYPLADLPGFRYWLAAIYLEYGIQAFNAGQYGLAEELWQKTLLQLPTAAMAWHGLALVHVKYKQFDRAAAELQQVVKLQKFLTFKKLTVSGQYYATKSWAALRAGDLAAAHRFYSQSLTPESWKANE